ncbi:MAG: YciI family protein [Acidimicrobiales bacterium]|nr:YciI family protein [Acidimicrobiales bacterium]
MKYLFLLNSHEDTQPEPGSPAEGEMFAAYGEAVGAMAKAGVLLDCAPLHARSDSTTVRVRDGETLLTDGPAAEIKEYLGGYTLVECADLDEALQWAATIPAARLASIEVRPVVAVERSS